MTAGSDKNSPGIYMVPQQGGAGHDVSQQPDGVGKHRNGQFSCTHRERETEAKGAEGLLQVAQGVSS